MIRIDFLLLTRANSNSNLQVGIGRLRERVCRRGDGRAHSPASRVLDGIGLIRGGNVPDLLAKPLENSARPGDIRDARIRSNGARLFRPRNISSLYSLVYLPLLPFSFPFPSLPFPSLPFLFYPILSVLRSFERYRQTTTCQQSIQIEPDSLFHCRFTSSPTERARTSVLALVLHISSVTSGAQLTIRIDPPRFACHQPISILPTYLFQRISSTLEFRPDTRDDRFFPTSLLSSTLCLRLELTRCGRETRILVSERGGRWGKLFHVVRDRATLYMIYITYNYILYTCHTKKRY